MATTTWNATAAINRGRRVVEGVICRLRQIGKPKENTMKVGQPEILRLTIHRSYATRSLCWDVAERSTVAELHPCDPVRRWCCRLLIRTENVSMCSSPRSLQAALVPRLLTHISPILFERPRRECALTATWRKIIIIMPSWRRRLGMEPTLSISSVFIPG